MNADQITAIISKYFPDEASFEPVIANLALTIQLKQVEVELDNLDQKAQELLKPIVTARYELNNKKAAIISGIAAQLPSK